MKKFEKRCPSSLQPHLQLAAVNANIISCAGAPIYLQSSAVDAKIDGNLIKTLSDLGASENFIDGKLDLRLNPEVKEESSDVTT